MNDAIEEAKARARLLHRRVRDGDEVRAGDVLIELDDAQARAVHATVRQTYLAQRAMEARLTAELTGAPSIRFHEDVLSATQDEVKQHMAAQVRLFEARRAAQAAAVAAQQEVIAGQESQIQGVEQMIASRQAQQALQSSQTSAVQRLADEGFAPRNQALQLAQAQAELRTAITSLRTEQLRLRRSQAEARERLAALRQEFVEQVSAQMADVQREVQANQERMLAAELDLSRMLITAPVAGQVLGLAVHNPGGVVEPSRPLMDILPRGEALVLDVKLPPHVIDTVRPGQDVEVRFSAFAATPHLVVMGKLTSVSGVVMADSGSPFRQSVLLNVGARDGIVDGWATMDGLGLVGRISGVGERTARVILLTDASSRIPVTIQPSGQRAMLVGDNTPAPPVEFLETPEQVRPGDRVISSGDGGIFPAGLLVGVVEADSERRLRVRLAADYERLSFLRVLRSHPAEEISEAGSLILPAFPPIQPAVTLPENAPAATVEPGDG